MHGGVACPAEGGSRRRFDDGSPAVVQRKVGKGRGVHFAWMPGLSYWKSSSQTKDSPAGFSDSLRGWIQWPVRLAEVPLPVKVDRPMVETPILSSPSGTAVTFLNWSGEPSPEVHAEVRSRGTSAASRAYISENWIFNLPTAVFDSCCPFRLWTS